MFLFLTYNLPEYMTHIMYFYEIKNENGDTESTDILAMFYGPVWESALDRLHHECDGKLLTLSLEGHKYFVYRRCQQLASNDR